MIEKKESTEMCIYEKLSRIQVELCNEPIKKSGWNPYGQFSFFELKDILPPVLRLCNKYECTLIFSFEEDYGYLFLKNWGNDETIKVTSPLPKLEKLPKMNLVQTNGTYQTYTKRYLLLNTFGIVEPELIDSLDMGHIEGSSKKSNDKKPVDSVPRALEKVVHFIREENPDVEITNRIINGKRLQMFREKQLTSSENKELYDYLQQHLD